MFYIDHTVTYDTDKFKKVLLLLVVYCIGPHQQTAIVKRVEKDSSLAQGAFEHDQDLAQSEI